MENPLIEAIKAIIYGIVEGLTEWLPVSSTGHIIIVSAIPGFDVSSTYGDVFWEFFLVVIQFGAICAVIWKFFKKLNPLSDRNTKEKNKAIWIMWLKILIGCLPAGIIGILLEEFLPTAAKSAFYDSVPLVTSMLILYGVLFVIGERFNKYKAKKYVSSLREKGKDPNTPYPYKFRNVEDIDYLTALYIGLIQVLSIVPGTSRSGVTILGALALGASRTAAAEFSFYLSIPVMVGATLVKGYSFYESVVTISNNMVVYLFFGTITAFAISILVINFLMKFIKKHTFEGFGYYRIAAGIVLASLLGAGIIA